MKTFFDDIWCYLSRIEIPVWIGIGGFVLSIFNSFWSYIDRLICVDVSYELIPGRTIIHIFNQSKRNIIITSLNIYTKRKSRFSRKKSFIHTPFDEPGARQILIQPYGKEDIIFEEEDNISEAFHKDVNTYITLYISKKKEIKKLLR